MTKNQRIDKLIEFLKTLQTKKPDPDQVEYTSWKQTEEEYQKQQAEWLEKIKQKKENG